MQFCFINFRVKLQQLLSTKQFFFATVYNFISEDGPEMLPSPVPPYLSCETQPALISLFVMAGPKPQLEDKPPFTPATHTHTILVGMLKAGIDFL